jgi:hypothetical protein
VYRNVVHEGPIDLLESVWLKKIFRQAVNTAFATGNVVEIDIPSTQFTQHGLKSVLTLTPRTDERTFAATFHPAP